MIYLYSPWYKIQRGIQRREVDAKFVHRENIETTFIGTPCVKSKLFEKDFGNELNLFNTKNN